MMTATNIQYEVADRVQGLGMVASASCCSYAQDRLDP